MSGMRHLNYPHSVTLWTRISVFLIFSAWIVWILLAIHPGKGNRSTMTAIPAKALIRMQVNDTLDADWNIRLLTSSQG